MTHNKSFPTAVVGSMPRPPHVKEMVKRLAESGGSTDSARDAFQRKMDLAVPYVVQMQVEAGIKLLGPRQRTILDESHGSFTHGCRQPPNGWNGSKRNAASISEMSRFGDRVAYSEG